MAQLVEPLSYKSEGHVGYISDGVVGIFHNTMALGSNRPVMEMCTKNISWGVGVKAAGAS